MKYIVPKGKHYSRLKRWLPFTFPKVFLHAGYHVMTCEIVITDSMFYDDSTLGSDNKDVNKIIGFGRGYHMNSSARLGFNCIDGKLHFYAYTHDDGKHSSMELLLPNEFNVGDKLFLMITDDYDRIHYYLGNDDDSVEVIHLKTKRFKKDSSKWSYYLKPYIGGNMPAVQDINFEIIDLW